MDWRHRARCRDVDPELFFPVGTTGPAEAQVQSAKAICALCPVAEPCFQGALERREPWGVWGGHLFANGKVLAQKRKRGRPPKNPPVEQLTA